MIHYMDKMKELGEFIGRRRTELGLTLEQVADVFGSTKQNIHNIEGGKSKDIKLSTLVGIAKALKVDYKVLMAIVMGEEYCVEPLKPDNESDIALISDILEVLKGRGRLK